LFAEIFPVLDVEMTTMPARAAMTITSPTARMVRMESFVRISFGFITFTEL
jgi:hypothetical protein